MSKSDKESKVQSEATKYADEQRKDIVDKVTAEDKSIPSAASNADMAAMIKSILDSHIAKVDARIEKLEDKIEKPDGYLDSDKVHDAIKNTIKGKGVIIWQEPCGVVLSIKKHYNVNIYNNNQTFMPNHKDEDITAHCLFIIEWDGGHSDDHLFNSLKDLDCPCFTLSNLRGLDDIMRKIYE